MFDGSVTIYGDNSNGNYSCCHGIGRRVNHNIYDSEQDSFMLSVEGKLIQDESIRFMCYSNEVTNTFPESVLSRVLCRNDCNMISWISNKIEFRKWASDIVTVPPSLHIENEPMDFGIMSERLQSSTLVIQSDRAWGGLFTYVLTEKEFEAKRNCFPQNSSYLVSKYIDSGVSVNMHAVIGKHSIALFPGSVQIILPDKNRMIYRGGDYIAYRAIDPVLRQRFSCDVMKIAEELREIGYRGIIGIDAIITHDNVYVIEANPRFQASSRVLNQALKNNGFPSLQRMHYDAFADAELPAGTENIVVNRSFFAYHLSDGIDIHCSHILSETKERNDVDVVLNGYSDMKNCNEDAYLFELSFERNIVDTKCFLKVDIHPNIPEPQREWIELVRSTGGAAARKISLINQGISFSSEALKYIGGIQKLRKGVNLSLDIRLPDMIVNCPVSVPQSDFTPFLVDTDSNGGFQLRYYGEKLCSAEFYPSDTLLTNKTRNGHNVSDICLASTDRLRIKHNRNCSFGRMDSVCRFCGDALFFDWNAEPFNADDIKDAVDNYFAACEFRHILIGGPSAPVSAESKMILQILEYLKKYPPKPVYVMCLPPEDLQILEKYKENGVTEVAFNIELFNRDIAKYYMPVKGRLPIERYTAALRYAVGLWGDAGNVRTSFIAGLEPMKSTLRGIEWCCSIGAAPIISIFRPVPDTPMGNNMPPGNKELLELYEKAQAVCHRYGLSLGPECDHCKNNTLAL